MRKESKINDNAKLKREKMKRENLAFLSHLFEDLPHLSNSLDHSPAGSKKLPTIAIKDPQHNKRLQSTIDHAIGISRQKSAKPLKGTLVLYWCPEFLKKRISLEILPMGMPPTLKSNLAVFFLCIFSRGWSRCSMLNFNEHSHIFSGFTRTGKAPTCILWKAEASPFSSQMQTWKFISCLTPLQHALNMMLQEIQKKKKQTSRHSKVMMKIN